MRIAHCILKARYSGAEILVLGLVRAQLAAGVPTALVSLWPSENRFEPELKALTDLGCEVLVPPRLLGRIGRIRWVRRAVSKFRPTVMFAHSVLPSLYSRLALMGLTRPSLVTVLHTDDDFANWILRGFERVMWRSNSAVVGVSAASIRNYIARITKNQEVLLIPNGIDVEGIRASQVHRDEVRQRVFQSTPDEVIILQVGRISPQKQQRLSVEAFGALSRLVSPKQMRLVFVGIEEYKDYFADVQSAIRAQGIEDRVQVLGSRSDVAMLLSAADVHLMPSAWEAQGIVALEALASGIYCIFTPLESFRPFANMAGVSLLPESADAAQFAAVLADVLSNSPERNRFHRPLDTYRFEQCAEQYMRLGRTLDLGGDCR